jgi:hypothetical protein
MAWKVCRGMDNNIINQKLIRYKIWHISQSNTNLANN